MAKIKISRTFMPEIIAPGTGLSPITDKSVIPFNNVTTIEDILNGKKYQIPGGGGDWSQGWGEDDFKSYRETGGDYKREERDADIFSGFNSFNPENSGNEEWTVRVKGGTKKFHSLNSFLDFKRQMKDKGVDVIHVTRTKVAQNMSVESVVARSMDSIFKIQSVDSEQGIMETGEGFCFAPGYFMTCAHVVKKYNKNLTESLEISEIRGKIIVTLVKDDQRFNAEVIAISASLDVAILKANVDCVTLALKEEATIGEEIFAVGSPHGFEDNVSFGHIGSLNRKIYTHYGAPDYMFLDLSVFSGNSGGPVLTNDGKVVAMVTAIVAGSGEYGLNAGLPVTYMKNFCAKNNIDIS